MEKLMSKDVMEYMVWVVELTAAELFNGNKSSAYKALLQSGVWELYSKNYDTTHTLGAEYIIDEIQGLLDYPGRCVA